MSTFSMMGSRFWGAGAQSMSLAGLRSTSLSGAQPFSIQSLMSDHCAMGSAGRSRRLKPERIGGRGRASTGAG